MALILTLDIATSMGWAVYDIDRSPSSVECSAINLSCKGLADKDADIRRLMREKIDVEVCKLIDRYRPDIACLESPLSFIKTGETKAKPLKLFKDDPTVAAQEASGGKEAKGGPNSKTVLMLNQIFACAFTVCAHKCSEVMEVAPTTWQTLTKQFRGDTKERSIAFCRQHRIIIPPELNKGPKGDAADAAVMTQWAAGQLQKRKMLQRTGQAA